MKPRVHVVSFDRRPLPSLAQVGGKGLSLMRMTHAGLAVPPGFVLATSFFEPWLAELRASDEHRRLGDEHADLSALCEALKARALGLTLAADRRAELARALQGFGADLLAVRSSSPEEDLEGSSFAGGYETVLGVTADRLEDAVRLTFASCLDARVAVYKRRHGFDLREPRIAVVVQRQVRSEVAGVAFSVDPIDNDHDHAVIDASWGLGEAVVAGLVSPDHFIIDKPGRRVVERSVGAKETAIWLGAGGGTEERPDERRDEACLSDQQALAVGDQLGRIEELYGRPMDIEWAFAAGELYLLQARPITTHVPLLDELATAPGERRRLYLDVTTSVQGLLEPMSVMATSVLGRLLRHAFLEVFGREPGGVDQSIPVSLAGRLYVNLSNVLALASLDRVASFFAGLDALAAGALRTVDEAAVRNDAFDRRGLLWGALRRAPPRASMALHAALAPASARDACLRQAGEAMHTIDRLCHADPPLEELIDAVFGETVRLVMRGTLPLVAMSRRARAAIHAAVDDPALAEALSDIDLALPGNVTVEMGFALEDLAGKLPEGTPEELLDRLWRRRLPRDFAAGWSAFLAEHGHRGPRELDVAAPRYREEPRLLLEQMVRLRDLPADAAPRAAHARGQERRERAFEALGDHLRRRGRYWAARRVASHYQELVALGGLREAHKYYVIRAIDGVRTRLLAEADQLVRQGRLDRVEDIFDLTVDDVMAARIGQLDARARARERRAVHQRLAAAPELPRVFDSRGRIYRAARRRSGDPNEVLGQPISPGVATGRVKVLHRPDEKPIEPGDILVARATDPGWTPLFVSAGGVILEVGGMLQHGALVAREYGKPCVAGIEQATSVFTDGERVEIDGAAGIVRRLR